MKKVVVLTSLLISFNIMANCPNLTAQYTQCTTGDAMEDEFLEIDPNAIVSISQTTQNGNEIYHIVADGQTQSFTVGQKVKMTNSSIEEGILISLTADYLTTCKNNSLEVNTNNAIFSVEDTTMNDDDLVAFLEILTEIYNDGHKVNYSLEQDNLVHTETLLGEETKITCQKI